MSPAQKLEAAFRRHECAVADLQSKARIFAGDQNPQSRFALRELLTAAREYGAAGRALARLRP